MRAHSYILISFVLICSSTKGQQYSLSGKITNSRLEPLALASVQVKGLSVGAVTKEDGYYQLQLEKGDYELIVTMIGYKPSVIKLVVDHDQVQNILLEVSDANLGEVVVKSKIRDRSEEIIRQVIQRKEAILAAAGPYSCNVYIRASQEDSTQKKRKSRKSLPDSLRKQDPNADLHRMSMAEISLQYDNGGRDRIREERTGVVKRGNPESLFYLSLTEGDFNLYNNLIRSRVLSAVPFLSPVSYSGLAAYRYKMVAIEQKGTKKVYVISVRPRQLSNVTVEGEIRILDSLFVILEARFKLPNYHMAEYDQFEIEQRYSLIDSTAWMIDRQHFRYYSKKGKGKLSGETVANYRDFKFNREFPARYFGAEVSATAVDAYERDSSFWQQSRTEPLTEKEIRFIKFKDSLYRVTHSEVYLDSVDRSINRVTWKKVVLTGQTLHDHKINRTWDLPSLLEFYQPIQFGGTRISPSVFYSRIFPSRKSLNVFGNVSYGIRNKDFNGTIRIHRMYNPFNRGNYNIEMGREFQYIFSGDAWINMIKRSNFYLNNSLGFGHGLEIANGLFIYTAGEMALRRSVANYKTNSRIDSLLSDILDDNQAVPFEPYNAFYGRVELSYTPGQKYIREPKEKIILGSRWPTFYVSWRKGIPGVFDSKVDFDYLEFGMKQEMKMGITGISKYDIKTGSFPNKSDLRLIDYKFQRRGDPLLYMNPHEAFQSLDSTFPVFKRFYEGHYVHEFNGAIINKIPLLKKLQLREVAGAGFLIAPERKLRYAELFGGMERVFKLPFNPLIRFKLGVYVVGSAANQFSNPVQFKIGITTWDRRRNKWL